MKAGKDDRKVRFQAVREEIDRLGWNSTVFASRLHRNRTYLCALQSKFIRDGDPPAEKMLKQMEALVFGSSVGRVEEGIFCCAMTKEVQPKCVPSHFLLWPLAVQASALSLVVSICRQTLERATIYGAGRHFIALTPLIGTVIELLEAAHRDARSAETRELLFGAHAKVCHWHCYLNLPKLIVSLTSHHLKRLDDLRKEAPDQLQMKTDYLVLHGDVLKIAAAGDLEINNASMDMLKAGLDILESHPTIKPLYQGPRSIGIVTANSNKTDAEFDKSRDSLHRVLDRSAFPHATLAHIADGEAEMHGVRYARLGAERDKQAAIRAFERVQKEEKLADKAGEPLREEERVRALALKTKLARCRIMDPLEKSGESEEEALETELGAALRAGSTRVAVRAIQYLQDRKKLKAK